MIDGLDKLAEIEVLREAAQRPPAEVQRMQMPSPQAGLQSLGQQEVDMGTGMPVGFSPADAVGQVTNIAGQYAMANPQKTGPFAAALAAFGAGSEAANMIDKRVEAESEKENLDDVKSMAGSLPDRTRTVMPTMDMPMDMPVQAQEEIQVSEVAPQEGLASMVPMQEGGRIENENIEPFVDFLKDEEGLLLTAKIPTKGDRLTIGHGHASANVKSGQTITEEEADTLLRKDIKDRLPQIRRRIPKFDSFPEDLQVALLGEFFRGSLGGSPETIRLINQEKFKEASKEFLDHDEYRNAVERNRAGIRPRMEAVSEELKDYSDGDILDTIKSYGVKVKEFLGFQEGGDVGEYFEGQVEGKGDGMSDEIPFRVEGGNPDFALLSKDEYVIPADVVSMLGNGSSDAGADELDDFLTDVRKEAFGREEQQKEIDAEKGLSSIA